MLVAVAYHTILAPCGCKEAMVALLQKDWVVWVTVGVAGRCKSVKVIGAFSLTHFPISRRV